MMRFFEYVNESYLENNHPNIPVYRGDDSYVFFSDDSDNHPIEISSDADSYIVSINDGKNLFEFPRKSCDLVSNDRGIFLTVYDNSKWINSENNRDSVDDFIETVIDALVSSADVSEETPDDADFFLAGLGIDSVTPVGKHQNFKKLQNGEFCRFYLNPNGKNVRKLYFYKTQTSPSPFLKILCGRNKYSVESECNHGKYSAEHRSMSELNANPVLRYLIDGKLSDDKSILNRLEYYFKDNPRSENFDFVRSIISENLGEDMIDPSFYKR